MENHPLNIELRVPSAADNIPDAFTISAKYESRGARVGRSNKSTEGRCGCRVVVGLSPLLAGDAERFTAPGSMGSLLSSSV